MSIKSIEATTKVYFYFEVGLENWSFILQGTNIGHLFRRRQEAASVARRLSLEIEIAQISNKPRKTFNEIKYPENSTNSCDAEISRVEFSKTESPKPSIPKGENDLIS